jgi:hypothetical protein
MHAISQYWSRRQPERELHRVPYHSPSVRAVWFSAAASYPLQPLNRLVLVTPPATSFGPSATARSAESIPGNSSHASQASPGPDLMEAISLVMRWTRQSRSRRHPQRAARLQPPHISCERKKIGDSSLELRTAKRAGGQVPTCDAHAERIALPYLLS